MILGPAAENLIILTVNMHQINITLEPHVGPINRVKKLSKVKHTDL